ncbi:MAG TPA: PilZ domain-containing protein [Candidatus Aquilonibacter sp.]|nr:PilZ domain-containing protein [Candidatus Aquilonibacter sp.]
MHAALVKRSIADRRKERRYPICGAIAMRAAGIDVTIDASLEDISAGGCRVMSRVPLRMKHSVRVELPRHGGPSLHVSGQVVRAFGSSADRIYHYGIRFRFEDARERSALRAFVSMHARRTTSANASSAGRRVPAGAVDVKLPIDLFVAESGRVRATMLALRVDGMRVASAGVLRQEWTIKADLRLPNDATGEPVLVTVAACVRPGVREVRGQFVQDLDFVDAPLRVRTEIERYLYDLRVSGERSRR